MRRYALRDDQWERIKDILQDDRRAGEVIRRMRSLLKKAPFEVKNIDLNDLVRETVEFLSTLAIARKVELGSVEIHLEWMTAVAR